MLNGYVPRVDVGAGGDITRFGATLDALLALDFDRVLPGHGPPMTKAEVARFREYLALLEREVDQALARGASEDEAARGIALPRELGLSNPPFGWSHEENVRLMYQGRREAVKKGGG